MDVLLAATGHKPVEDTPQRFAPRQSLPSGSSRPSPKELEDDADTVVRNMEGFVSYKQVFRKGAALAKYQCRPNEEGIIKRT